MMEEQPKDWLDLLLEQQKAEEIPDDGFSQGVLQALPAPNVQYEKLLTAVLLVASCLACIIAFWLLPTGDFIVQTIQVCCQIKTWSAFSVSLTSLVVLAVIVFTGFSLATEN